MGPLERQFSAKNWGTCDHKSLAQIQLQKRVFRPYNHSRLLPASRFITKHVPDFHQLPFSSDQQSPPSFTATHSKSDISQPRSLHILTFFRILRDISSPLFAISFFCCITSTYIHLRRDRITWSRIHTLLHLLLHHGQHEQVSASSFTCITFTRGSHIENLCLVITFFQENSILLFLDLTVHHQICRLLRPWSTTKP